MSAPRVILCDDLDPKAVAVLRERGLEVEQRVGLDEAGLCEAAAEADALVVRSASRITRKVIESSTRLRAVGRAGIGVDNIDSQAATERGVVVMNTPGGNTLSTAELALTLVCALARNLGPATRRVRDGGWGKQGLMGVELTGKTLGIVGLGRVGRLLAERAQGIGMDVVAYDPYLIERGGQSPVGGVALVPLDDLLARSDFVSCHVPLVDATRGLIGKDALAKLKPGAFVVNTSRGGVVDEAAALEALDSGRLAGLALDVLEQEPPTADHPLLRHERVLVTPHLGASSHEAQERVALMIAEQLADFLLDGRARHVVNAPGLSAASAGEAAPVLRLAEVLGALAVQLLEGPPRELALVAAGDVGEHGLDVLRLGVLVGALRPTLDAGVNFVNAPLLAKERGLRVLEARDSADEYQAGHLDLRAKGDSDDDTVELRATLYGREPRIVRVDGMRVDFAPERHLLVTRHEDRPGVLGTLGTELGKAGVNIRGVDLGPADESRHGLASAFLAIDAAPPAAVLETLRALPMVKRLRAVRLPG